MALEGGEPTFIHSGSGFCQVAAFALAHVLVAVDEHVRVLWFVLRSFAFAHVLLGFVSVATNLNVAALEDGDHASQRPGVGK